jgi:uncharacterized protein (TIGR03083 family)
MSATTEREALTAIEDEGRRLIVIGRAIPERPVPQYPSWSMRDLVVHVGGVHGRTAEICRTLPQERIPAAELPATADPFDWAEARLRDMLAGLRSADPSAPVWTLIPGTTLGSWTRRMVVETGVHRWDADDAAGKRRPLSPIVASGGLDEYPAMWLPRLGALPALELQATDLGRSWRYGQGPPGARVAGTASDLYLRLVARPGVRLPEAWERAVDGLPRPTR